MSTTESSRLKRALSRVIEELDDEDVREEFEALKNRKVTYSDVLEAIREAPPEERKALREMLAEEMDAVSDDDPPKPPPKPKAPPDPEPPAPPAATRRTRPGRKSGGAYDWYIDDETGDVVRSPVAVVYSGPDEPDEVEMLPPPPADDDDAGGDDE